MGWHKALVVGHTFAYQGGWGGSLWCCLRTRQPTHPPTHPDPPLPPPWGGGSVLLQSAGNTKTLCICPKKILSFSQYAIFEQ